MRLTMPMMIWRLIFKLMWTHLVRLSERSLWGVPRCVLSHWSLFSARISDVFPVYIPVTSWQSSIWGFFCFFLLKSHLITWLPVRRYVWTISAVHTWVLFNLVKGSHSSRLLALWWCSWISFKWYVVKLWPCLEALTCPGILTFNQEVI